MSRMIGFRRAVGAGLAVALVCGTVAFGRVTAQQPPQAASQAKQEKPLIPLRVQVTISRYEGAKMTSSLPFTLWVNANGESNTSLNVGSRVPTPQPTVGVGPGVVDSYSYNPVGTNLQSSATSLDDGRFNVSLTISDSSLAPAKSTGGVNLPTFQSFSSQNRLLLRDGQVAQFIAATDKVSGEVTRVEVTISVIK